MFVHIYLNEAKQLVTNNIKQTFIKMKFLWCICNYSVHTVNLHLVVYLDTSAYFEYEDKANRVDNTHYFSQ